jgi:tetratricopeptide (TPR) repeat protein
LEGTIGKTARERLRFGDLDGADLVVDEGLRRCDDQGNSPETWSLRLIRADLMRLRGKNEDALKYLASTGALFPPDPGDIPSLAGLGMHCGHFLGLLGRYAQADGSLLEAERMARDAGLLELQCEVHQRQAILVYFRHDYASSDRLFRRILDIAGRTGDQHCRAVALWGIGKNLMIQEHYTEAILWLNDSLDLFEHAESRLWMAGVWSEMAVCHLGFGDDAKALKLFEGALQVACETRMAQGYLVALANIGNVYLHRGDHLTAIEYYRRALELAREIKDPVSIQKWSHNLRLAYARLRQSVDRLDSRTA